MARVRAVVEQRARHAPSIHRYARAVSSKRIPDPGFAGDEGHADPVLAAALAAAAQDPGRQPEVLAALHRCRVLAPVVAVLGESDVGASGLPRDKTSDIAVPLLGGADGRRALPVFTGLAALARWDPQARPVPVEGRRAAQVALAESAEVLVLDVAGPVTAVLETAELRALAEGRGAVPAYDDAELAAALSAVLAREEDVTAAYLLPQPGADARLEVAVAPPGGDVAGSGLPARLAGRLGELAAVRAAAVRGLDLAVLPAGEAPTRPGVSRPLFS
jgi:type III secretion system (T3SS) SseB-like protein